MIHSQEPPSVKTMNQRREDHPLRISLTQRTAILQPESAKRTTDDGSFSRQIGIVFPQSRLAAPVHGDFISQVGRAYKMSATKGLKHAFQHESNASARRSRWQGLDVNCCSRHRTRGTIRPQAIDKSGKNSSKDNGSSTESRQGKLCAHSIGGNRAGCGD